MRAIKMLVAALALQAAIVASAQPVQLLHPTNVVWRYQPDGSDQGTAWRDSLFDDSTWPQGNGLFGNEAGYPYPMNTTIPGGAPITVYYRTHFTWSGGTAGVVLTGTNYVDDGSIIYLNGVEIMRFNMPADPIDFNTSAPAANPGGFPNTTGGEPALVLVQIPLGSLTNGNANPLIVGDNVVAVEVHQAGVGSSDRVHGLALYAQQAIAPCTDGIEPTDRAITEGLNTTFTVVEGANCGVPDPSFQWYRNVGFGEELIPGATGTSYTLSNAVDMVDEGVYYCRLTNPSGIVDSRQAVLTINTDVVAPVFISASVVGPGLNTFRLLVNEQLCMDSLACGSDFTFQFNWQINQSDNLSVDLGVASITMINSTTYEFTTSNPRDPSKQYQITVTPIFGEISDLHRNFVAPGTFAETLPQASFQQGDANGYTGTQDTELHSNATADTVQGAQVTMTIDNDDAGIAHGLIRFDNIFGTGPGQIPPGSMIVSATLTLNQNNEGSFNNFHRMLMPWDQATATWNSMVNGLSADDVEAAVAIDATSTGPGVANGPIAMNVTVSVQAWANGQANYGWAIISTGGNGWDVDCSEGPPATAPLLTVEYRPVVCDRAPTITTQPPAAVPANEGASFSITAGVSICGNATFQWTKDGTDIPGANSSTYTVASAVAGALGSGGSYRLRAANEFGPVTSDAAVVTVTPDLTRPRVTRAVGSPDGTTITLTFSKALSGAAVGNFSLTPSVSVNSAVLSANALTVTVTTATRTFPTPYRLSISGLTDTRASANVINPNPTLVDLTSASVVETYGATWQYETNSQDATLTGGTPWYGVGFNDSAWLTGQGLFGFELGTIAGLPAIMTPLVPLTTNAAQVTHYFRRQITLPALPANSMYVVCHWNDDGAIFYLDGVEVNRYLMPSGSVTFTNRATGTPANGGDATLVCFPLNTTAGSHLLAVENHQSTGNSSDVVFGAEVRIVTKPTALSISHGPANSVLVSWTADSTYELVGSQNVDGNAAAVAGAPFGLLSIPTAGQTNHFFYHLRYRDGQ